MYLVSFFIYREWQFHYCDLRGSPVQNLKGFSKLEQVNKYNPVNVIAPTS